MITKIKYVVSSFSIFLLMGCALDASLITGQDLESVVDDIRPAASLKICADGPVFSEVKLSNGATVFGGDFDFIGRCSDSFFKYDPTSGQTQTFADPGIAVGETRTIEPDGSGGFYFGGVFKASNGSYSLVHINSSGVAYAWDPKLRRADGELPVVNSVKLSGGRLYIGGRFDSAGTPSVIRSGLAVFDVSTGEIINWSPALTANSDGDLFVRDLLVDGTNLYISGAFENVGDNAHTTIGVAKLNLLDENADAAFTAMSGLDSNTGKLTLHNGVLLINSNGFVRLLDPLTGAQSSWMSTVTLAGGSSLFYDFVLDGNDLWLGGSFSTVNGHATDNIAKFNFAGATPVLDTSWATSYEPEGWVGQLVITDSHILNIVNGGIWYFNKSNGTAFSPAQQMPIEQGQYVTSLTQGEQLIVGTNSRTVGADGRRNLAMLDANGNLMSWDPAPGGTVYSVAVHNDRIFIGGDFVSVGATPTSRQNIAEIDLSGEVTSFVADANYEVRQIQIVDGEMFVAGDFTSIGLAGDGPAYLAKLSIDDGSALSWTSQVDNRVYALEYVAGKLIVGGGYSSIAGQSASNLAIISAIDGSWIGGAPTSNSWIYGIVVEGSSVYLAGTFSDLGGTTRNGFGSFDLDSGLVGAWAPDVTCYAIRSMRKHSGEIVAIAHFNRVNGIRFEEGMLTIEADATTVAGSHNIFYSEPW